MGIEGQPVRRCVRCLIPESFPGADFDGEGVCRLCRGYVKTAPLGEERLKQILNSRKGQRYDCLVGISGGKDSCFVAYLARKRFDLKVLAVCYDFPFLVDLARENVRNVCESLSIDLEVVRTKNGLERKLLRNHMKALAPTGTTWGQCLFCHYGIDGVLYNKAQEHDIPFVLGGVTKYELWDPGSRMGFLLSRLKKLSLTDKFRFAYHQGMAWFSLVDQRCQFRLPGNSRYKAYEKPRWPEEGSEHINVYDYVQWDQDEIERTLMSETGWKKPDKAISWRYDCILEPLLDYTYKKEFGISTAGIYLSHLVRDGLMAREEALEKLRQSEDQEMLNARLAEVCSFLGLPPEVERRFQSACQLGDEQEGPGA